MMNKLLRFGRRHLHTIVSRDIIKPSSPTAKTYNLSLFDQMSSHLYIPIVAFYPGSSIYKSSRDKTLELKNSLSETLNKYYPFAGRLKQHDPTYVDCNDKGVEFVEASNDSPLSDFLRRSEHEDLDQLFPNDLMWFHPNLKGENDEKGVACASSVQVNHFACGGVAVAISLSHKIGDGRTALNFMNHWATVNAKAAPLINPHVLHHETVNTNFPELTRCRSRVGCVTRSFLFPNKKLNDLKAKVTALTVESGQPIMNPTRVEVLSWLLHKCAVTAATNRNSGSTFKATGMLFTADMRNILVEELPRTTLGNFYQAIVFPTSNQTELEPHMTISEFRKQKKQLQSIDNMETVTNIIADMSFETVVEISNRIDESYVYSSLCRFPTYGIDFGWGKPVKVTLGGTIKNLTVLMDTPNNDGIEAIVCLEKDDMKTFQNDPELLAYR
ncbi:deacetylvindoline O-acetyltransferase [Artemisia annua]|uniref:Deacetylvindoline O-acetyltransferase n=1 Tax=Artemisia annua TaxID=35608 RepID=A0A2U1MXN8_ARTAN|nr:deacetylvindoline O-acetyltransferase [Artemisia annua]